MDKTTLNAKKESALLLLSGGIDSAVAGFVMKKFNIEFTAIHFLINPSSDREKIKKLAKIIGIKKILFVPHYENLKEFSKNCNNRYLCIFCKRMMYRISERLAEKLQTEYIISGENLGQVASQTLPNLFVLASSIKTPVLRPLLTYNKQEIIDKAGKIGTFDISIKNAEACSFVPKNPITNAKKEIIEAEEKRLDIEELIRKSIENMEEE